MGGADAEFARPIEYDSRVGAGLLRRNADLLGEDADVERRIDAAMAVQPYEDTPMTPRGEEQHRRRQAMRARLEVRETIATIGVIEHDDPKSP